MRGRQGDHLEQSGGEEEVVVNAGPSVGWERSEIVVVSAMSLIL